ncbi:hypothetical protein QYE76_000975 [Lolium multiflorum]|uniref:Inosine/uridine-preferring nucleoside hydrolase domain-containing protein n=1 Tax=Lolium multiflorum TaxID=4521 RepID=A0AAD8RJT3_LOLMU|nr:hypothetical protein QYE76_000975 [Lolium multiflorum]
MLATLPEFHRRILHPDQSDSFPIDELSFSIQGAMVTMPFPGADAWHRPLRVVCGSLGALNLATGNGDDVLPQCGCLAPSTVVAGCLWRPWCRTTAMLALQIMSTNFEKMLGTCKVNKEDVQRIHDKVNQILNEDFTKSTNYVCNMRDCLTDYHTTFKSPKKIPRVCNTLFPKHTAMCKRGEVIDWAMADALDFASPIDEGNHVRLSGQDMQRGSFSQRHLLLHDQETEPKYCPFDHVMVIRLTTIFGNVTTEYATRNALFKGLCDRAGHPEVPIAEGSPEPLKGGEPRVADFVHGSDGLDNLFLSAPTTNKVEESAAKFLVNKTFKTISMSKGKEVVEMTMPNQGQMKGVERSSGRRGHET